MDLRGLAEDADLPDREAAKAAGTVLEPVEAGDPVVVEADRRRIARALVEAHGGMPTLESEGGAGTRAVISFPAGASSVSEGEPENEREYPPAPTTQP